MGNSCASAGPAVVQAAIMAVEAELASEQRGADPDKLNTEATPPDHDGSAIGDTEA